MKNQSIFGIYRTVVMMNYIRLTQFTFVLILSASFTLFSCSSSTSSAGDDDPEFIQDIDMNTYPVVRIGNQLWLGQNLTTTRYRNGDPIPEVQGQTDWGALNSGAWARYQNIVQRDFDYGKLYNWHAVNDPRGICPEGWKVPSDDDWKTLERHLGMTAQQANGSFGRGADVNAGGKLKLTSMWDSPNIGATNESGFNGNPGGRRLPSGLFDGEKKFGFWWTSTEANQAEANYRGLFYRDADISRFFVNKRQGFSVRCIMD